MITKDWQSELAGAIKSGDQDKIVEILAEIEAYLTSLTSFPEKLFDEIVMMLAREDILSSQNSAYLLKPIEYNLSLLSHQQQAKLMNMLPDIYVHSQDEATCMLILDLLTDIAPTEKVIPLILSIQDALTENQRALLSYGIARFANKFTQGPWRERAIAILMQMKRDHSEVVSREADWHLKRLK